MTSKPRARAVTASIWTLSLLSGLLACANEPPTTETVDPILSRFKAPYEADVVKTPIDGREIDAMISDLPRFLEGNRLAPQAVPGWQTAYRLETIAEPTLLKLGLREGDVILGINGIDLGSMEQLATALSMLRHASLLQLVIQRRGVIFDLNFEMQDRRIPL